MVSIMKYPKFLKNGDVIGITALSGGCKDAMNEIVEAIANIEEYSLKVITTSNVSGDDIVSSCEKTRLLELNELLDKTINLLLIARGGNFLYEIIDKIPFDKIYQKNIFVMGYSDPTSLLYILTVKYDLATIYGMNAKSFSGTNLLDYQKKTLSLIKGRLPEYKDYARSLYGEFSDSGILIWGCLEVLKDLVGTKYDDTLNFLKKYQKVIWYFDIYDSNPVALYNTLLQFKYAGWFEYGHTFIFSEVLIKHDENIMKYEDAIKKAITGNIIMNAKIGHVKPSWTVINGAFVMVSYQDGEFSLRQKIDDKI